MTEMGSMFVKSESIEGWDGIRTSFSQFETGWAGTS